MVSIHLINKITFHTLIGLGPDTDAIRNYSSQGVSLVQYEDIGLDPVINGFSKSTLVMLIIYVPCS